MNRRGFALLSAMWLSVVLAALAAGVVDVVRVESKEASNRTLAIRAAWARFACQDILQARFAESRAPQHVDTVDLGRGVWCVARLEPVRGSNLNRMTRDQLIDLVRSDTLVNALLDWIDADTVSRSGGNENDWYRGMRRHPPRNGPVIAIDELLLVRGFDSALVARIASRAHVMPLDLGGPCIAQSTCSDSTTLIADVDAGFRGVALRSHGRRIYRSTGTRLAVLLEELE